MNTMGPDLEAGSNGSRLDQAETRSRLTGTRPNKRRQGKNKHNYGVETTAYQPRGTNTYRPQIGNKGRFNPNLEAAPPSPGGQGRKAGDEILQEANSCQPSLSDVASTYRSHRAEQRTLGDAINQERSKGRFVCRHAPSTPRVNK
ncbi:hypothetical protein BO79DRAFT_232312 [Aspergillus costaricaensis CBS 115574]|uniref:Uncharacterized protein n=1 Tax=Aspergillus costaricaensis CBS 115574 TaxID=1448317 RepID=A0ACD1I233_9EURO|nr:hypothetical protein BO79DRAFT_232312 [Aspergillus costaricaensis CBS 115574]RAK84596.1 hypothetical protein BO79DRAFT_232312 [Aspergillus costaricaensis CBS 115574]